MPARRAATAAARPMGAFSTGVPVDWGLSQRSARVDCRLSYTTGQATSSIKQVQQLNIFLGDTVISALLLHYSARSEYRPIFAIHAV